MDATSTCSATQMYAALQVFSCLELTAYMCPRDTLINDIKRVQCDYIIVGAGSSGSVLANRLTEDQTIQVCVLEAGGDPPFEKALPVFYPYSRQTSNLWNYNYEIDSNNPTFHKGGVSPLSLDKMLGGSSNDDYLYERGNPTDYDEWSKMVNDESWNYANALQAFIKSENLHDAIISHSEYQKYHGTDGYLGVSKQYNVRTNKYLDAVKDIGFNELEDFSGENVSGYGRSFLNLANNVHQSAAFSFLTPISSRTNLKMFKRKTVVRLHMSKKKTVKGVCFIDRNTETCLEANREVILSAGAINTAKILLQSGIGPKDHLKSINIKCISDLPVGRNLFAQSFIPIMHATEKFIQPPENLGPYVFPVPLILGRVAKDTSYPEYRSLNHILTPSLMLQYCLSLYDFSEDVCQMFYDQVENREVMLTQLTPYKPISRGYVELRSSNYLDAPIIHHGIMSASEDLDTALNYVKDFNRIRESAYFKEVNASPLKLVKCSNYEIDSDDYWRCYLKGTVTSTNCHSGTVAMGSVVDSGLRVKGIRNLRIADSGIIPIPISAGSYITNVMIGERAAEIILSTHNKKHHPKKHSKKHHHKGHHKGSKEKSHESGEDSHDSGSGSHDKSDSSHGKDKSGSSSSEEGG